MLHSKYFDSISHDFVTRTSCNTMLFGVLQLDQTDI